MGASMSTRRRGPRPDRLVKSCIVSLTHQRAAPGRVPAAVLYQARPTRLSGVNQCSLAMSRLLDLYTHQ